LADAQAEKDALIKEANQGAEQVIKKSKFALKSDEDKAKEIEQDEAERANAKIAEEAAKAAAIAEGKGSSLSLAAEDNYLNYEDAEMDPYVPGDGITGKIKDDSDEGSLTMGEEDETLGGGSEEISEFEFKIRKLKIMLEHNLITEDEFNEMRKNLLSEL
jgi:hypothetical protein